MIVIMLTLTPGSYFQHVKITLWEWLSPDKIVHLMMFLSLSFISLWGFRKQYQESNTDKRKKLVVTILSLSLFIAAATEALQSIPILHRHSCIYDLIANIIGCVLGTYIFIWTYKKSGKKNSPGLDTHK